MQKQHVTEPPSHHRARTSSLVMAVLLLALSLVSVTSAAAQDATPDEGTPVSATPTTDGTPMATPAAAETNALGTVLMQYEFDEMPQTPLTVRLLRITLEPGAQSPMHTHPGPEFDMVESGTLTANIDGTAIAGVGADTSEVTESQSLGIGQWIMFPTGTGMNLVNEGDEDLVLLAAVVLPVGADVDSTITYTDGEPTDEDLAGVSFTVLGDGLIQQLPAGGATVTIDLLTVEAGSPIPGFTGPAMLSKSEGDFSIRADEGQVQVTRTATPQLQPNAIPGQEFAIGDNDAAFFPAGYETIARSGDAGELTFTRLLITPQSEPANAPATVADITTASTASTGTTDEGSETTSGSPLGIGAVVAINTDDVNLRAEATTDSNIVDTYPAGTQFEIIGGPVVDDDYVWYEVVGIGELSDVQGWLVTEFMDVIEMASSGQQGEDGSSGSSETPSTPDVGIFGDIDLSGAETTTPPADIEIGSLVQTTDSNVRIRAESNSGGDIIEAVPTGTEFEVIGGPETADGFTWYEVQATSNEDVSGWVASDFLEVVDASGS